MWRYIELRNYRSIASAWAYLPPLTIVVGPNGSGKSNFADALVFGDEVGVDAAAAIERRGGITGVRRWSHSRPYDVAVEIYMSRTQKGVVEDRDYVRHAFTIKSYGKGKWRFSSESVEVKRKNRTVVKIERENDRVTMYPVSFVFPDIDETTSVMVFAKGLRGLGHGVGSVRRVRLSPDLMRAPQMASPEPRKLDESGSNIAVAIRRLSAPRRRRIVEVMARIIPGLQEIKVETVGRHLLLKFVQRHKLDKVATFFASDMSEGALRALGIVVAAEQMTRDELLVIEEPEVNIHTGASSVLFDVLKEASRKGAVLITTHSADLLDAASEETILVTDYREGVTEIGSLEEGQRSVVREGLFSVAELLRSEPLRIDKTTG